MSFHLLRFSKSHVYSQWKFELSWNISRISILKRKKKTTKNNDIHQAEMSTVFCDFTMEAIRCANFVHRIPRDAWHFFLNTFFLWYTNVMKYQLGNIVPLEMLVSYQIWCGACRLTNHHHLSTPGCDLFSPTYPGCHGTLKFEDFWDASRSISPRCLI